jgi:hypothetical protein
MKILLTFDYELFFGAKVGSFERCILEPVNELVRIGNKYDVKYTFFVDAGYLSRLNSYHTNKSCRQERSINLRIIEELLRNGHDIQLHIHPHWEDSSYSESGWDINPNRYRLSQFSKNEIEGIVFRYKDTLTSIVGDNIFAYRAGGWCIQPFDKIKDALKENNIWMDSTVFSGGISLSSTHFFDFRNAPNDTMWRFEDDPLIKRPGGFFTELPISSLFIGPIFYWKFAISRKLGGNLHKAYGDGVPIGKTKSELFRLLINGGQSVASTDGYKILGLFNAYNDYKKRYGDNGYFVTIGHPKACTLFSLKMLERFILTNLDSNEFITCEEVENIERAMGI